MGHTLIINKTIAFVKEQLKNSEPGHDWWHVYRVWNMAEKIAINYPVNQTLLGLSALLHDIADAKFHNGNEESGPSLARDFLQSNLEENDMIDKVCQVIKYISFKNKGEESPDFIEFKIIQDADRLDAIGAIGIARAFSYGGNKLRQMYNPEIKPIVIMTDEQYKKNNGPTINHFYEKLLKIKDLLNTPEARQVAEKRHSLMLKFLESFYNEWNANDL